MKIFIPSPKVEASSKKIFYTFAIVAGVICFIYPIGLQISKYFGSNCNPNYSPCVANARYDLDCSDIGFQVTVKGSDVYRLDSDDDGTGCENNRLNVFWHSIIFGAVGAWVGGWIGLFVSLGYENYEKRKQKKISELIAALKEVKDGTGLDEKKWKQSAKLINQSRLSAKLKADFLIKTSELYHSKRSLWK